jgi:PAS domain S-box-containing protein
MERKVSLTKLSTAAGLITVVMGLIVLIGWQFDFTILKSFQLSVVPMMANTAAAFLLTGFALIFFQRSSIVTNIFVRVCATVTALVGLLTLFQYFFGWDFGIDQILFRDPGISVASSYPGRMAPNTALNFLLIGFAFFLLTLRKFRISFLVEFLLIFSLSISVLGLVGYLTGLLELTGPAVYTQMASNTAFTFIILCVGMLFACYGRQRAPITIEQKLFAGLTAAVAIIIFITFLFVSGSTSLIQASNWVKNAHEVKNRIGTVLVHILDIQSGDRGFVLTGDDSFLVVHRRALKELPALLNEIRSQTTDNPRQQNVLAVLKELVGKRVALSELRIATRRTEGEAKARLLFPIGSGKMLTDSIRVLVTQMIAEEDRLLDTRNDDEARQAFRNQLIIYHSLMVQVLLLVFIFVVVKKDVSGRRRAEEQTRQTKELLDSIVENIPMMIFMKDAKDLRFVRFNKAGEDLLGFGREELIGKNDYDFFTKDEADFFTSKDREVLADHRVVSIPEEPIQTKYKGVRTLHTIKVPLMDEQGKVEYLLGISLDITERKKAEEALQLLNEDLEEKVKERTVSLHESEKRLRSLYENSTIGLYRTAPNGEIILANPTLVKMLGYSSFEELAERNLEKEGFKASYERKYFIEQIEKNGSIKGLEAAWTKKDGTVIYINESATAIRDANGKTLYFDGTVEDITEREHAKILQKSVYSISEAAQSTKNLPDLYAQIHNIVCELMPAKNFYIALYDSVSNLLHFPYHADEYDTDWAPIKPDRSLTAYVLRTRNPLLATSDVFEKFKSSGKIDLIGTPSIDWLGVPLKAQKGEPIGVMVVQTYTTDHRLKSTDMEILVFVSSQIAMAIERKQAEEKLLKLSRAVEQSSASVVITDLDGKIEYVNPKFTQLTGYTSTEAIGQNPRILKSGEKLAAEYKQMWEIIKSGKEWQGEFHNKKKNGELYWESASISPIKDASGKITHYLAVKEDITEKKSLEAQLLRSQRIESIGTLAGGIAHDLNNVLAPILLSVEYFRKLINDETGIRTLDILEASAKRGTDIIKQVLTFARGVEGEKGIVQLKHLISEMENIIKETFPRSIQSDLKIAKDLWTINGEATNLHQVLLNLCVNARDAMPNGGRLKLVAENIEIDESFTKLHLDAKPGRYVVLTVADTGTGIPKEILSRIFDPFYTTKPIGKGTGLGLSTVHAIVKSHGGFINVYTEVGKGTTFKAYLPAAELERATMTGSKTKKLLTGNGELILVVDDEASICEVTHQMLEMSGYRVITAPNGAEALVTYKSRVKDIALVITDMMMPIMDGPQTVRQLRKINSEVKIIASSGLMERDDIVKVGDLTADAFITKPYGAERLLEIVHSVLHKES